MNPLQKLNELGHSVWLDSLSRRILTDGTLKRLISEDGVGGVTSNPAIFEQAMADSDDYDDAMAKAREETDSVEEIFHRLAIEDIQTAADQLQQVFFDSAGKDGFVSLEVSPHLAHDTEGTISRAQELWARVSRPNVLIKIPGTKAGLPAIRRCIADGINVNVTLLFGLQRYRDVAEAFIGGIEDRLEAGDLVERVASVASFFLSRIDSAVDTRLDALIEAGGDKADKAQTLRGEIAIASAKQAYAIYKELFEGERFAGLRSRGVQVQRLLWASTSAKDERYSDVKYVEPLISAGTINTMPMSTLEAYRDHGDPKVRLEDDMDEARTTLTNLGDLGIDLDAITAELETEGLEKFVKPYDSLLAGLEKKLERIGA